MTCSVRARCAFGLVVAATSAPPLPASNLGYRVRLSLDASSPSGPLYWVSLPYVYTPQDFGTIGVLDAEDLIQDLQPLVLTRPCTGTGCAVAEVRVFDPTTGEYLTWSNGGTGTPFELDAGASYAVILRTVGTHTVHAVHVVGAHDPTLQLEADHVPNTVNLRWISLPPHLDIDTTSGIPDVLDAEDLGLAMGGPTAVFQLRQLDEATGLYRSWVVNSAYGTPFPVDLTRGVGVDLTCPDLGTCSWSWTPPTR
jgi:hypothetical protein